MSNQQMTAAALRACLSQSTDEVFLECLSINHADLSEPIRVVKNTEIITSGGHQYYPFRFDVTLPADAAEKLGELSLTISNVDRRIAEAARMINSAAIASFFVVLASSPNTIEYGPVTMALRNVKVNLMSVVGTLRAGENILYQAYPAHSFVPSIFPGMFT